ncbi:hypothetical protein T8K17_16350 [Thalassobaculum sp. OXR-137]|uniref:hypothetical protein n=1 Tax=Thalassobaculum sp. OXR-137 TaxID=3100173 RepID=UPI002AC9979C|nr:hypothetical protein [Thalassobaculum sp. OXR-137]WPZ32806.1 hypothetical protein T8K17_16350 [Thalassobaculum sp. OXR-137]
MAWAIGGRRDDGVEAMTDTARWPAKKRPLLSLSIAAVASTLLAACPEALALSPQPFFSGVDRLVLFCGRPLDADQRTALCTVARDVLSGLAGREIELGTGGLSDPAAITVLVNGYPMEGPNGPLLAIDIDLLRKDMTDGQLFGAPPVLVPAKGLVTAPEIVGEALRAELAERVIAPWRLSAPAVGHGRTGKTE